MTADRLAEHIPVIEGYCGESDIILTCTCGWEQADGGWLYHLAAAGVTVAPQPAPDALRAEISDNQAALESLPYTVQGADLNLPHRVVVDQHGHYWRDYGDFWSMCPVKDENVETEVVAAFTLAQPAPDALGDKR